MRLPILALGLALLCPSFASAKESALLSSTSTSQPRAQEDIRLLGRLNANLATREELLSIPGLETAKVDAILDARSQGTLSSLVPFALSPDVLSRLTLEGTSTLRRIRVLPLETIVTSGKSASR